MGFNFPIFNNDYNFTLEEIIRYLKHFNHRVTIKRSYSYFVEDIFFSEHKFNEGLMIRLHWYTKKHNIHEISQNMQGLMKFHKIGDIKLKDFDFVSYSNNYVYIEPPYPETEDIFYNGVLHGRKKQPYNKAQYLNLEFNTKFPIKSFDLLFTFLQEEIDNKRKFEIYYNEYKKNQKNRH